MLAGTRLGHFLHNNEAVSSPIAELSGQGLMVCSARDDDLRRPTIELVARAGKAQPCRPATSRMGPRP